MEGMIDFDKFRKDYNSMTFKEKAEFNREMIAQYPNQRYAHVENFKNTLERISPKPRVMELGCYDGYLADKCRDQVFSWHGFDIVLPAFTIPTCMKFSLLYKPFWEVEFNPKDYDAFVCSHTIEHFSDVELEKVIDKVKGIEYILIEAPIRPICNNWAEYDGAHVLEMGYEKVKELLSGYQIIEEMPDLWYCVWKR